MTQFSEKEEQESLNEAPEWLRDALAAQRVSPGFRERCREAAMVAHSIAVMRKTRARSEFVPDTLERYIYDLADAAGVKAEPILSWLGIRSLGHPEPSEGRAYARLGRALGMKAADLIGHIVVSLGVAEGTANLALPRLEHQVKDALRVGPIVQQLEEALSPKMKHDLRLIQAEIKKEYDSGS